jgi:Zn-dependent protease with chaperone function
MGLGLPLLRVLTISQLRAVLAHEFGHYYGGDTKLGPWIYKTRSAIGRTLDSLRGHEGWSSLLQLPFLWYGKMFLRITHAVSRR